VSNQRLNYLTKEKNIKIKNEKSISSTVQAAHNHSDMDLIKVLSATTKTDVRRLTPTESERLQGFPDGYTEGVSDTQRYKTLGNAVTVNVVTSLINKMFKGSEYDRTRK
tara:strand:+ start:265 stop:591 length:327 start_codon:yes stop_codon:yes gene_type:complete